MNAKLAHLASFLVSIFATLISVGCSGGAASESTPEWCIPGVPRHAPHAITGITCPTTGRMGGTKLAIPQHYLLGPIGYKGIDIWDAKSFANRPRHPTLDTELTNIAIKIRQTNFKPIETQQDLDDYGKLGHAISPLPPRDRWIHVAFEFDPQFIGIGEPVSLKGQLALSLKDEDAGRYTLQKTKPWGLDHYVSSHRPSTEIRGGTQRDIYYDAKTNATIINCKSWLRSVPPYDLLTSCRHDFFTPQGDIRVTVGNIQMKTDLARWREVEKGVRRVFQSFIIH